MQAKVRRMSINPTPPGRAAPCFCLVLCSCLGLASHSLPVHADNIRSGSAGDRAKMSDTAIVTLIIAASIAAYKSKGKPCACPSDTMSNGRACGSNSAHSRGGGARPLCFPTDVTPQMISAYRAAGVIPRP